MRTDTEGKIRPAYQVAFTGMLFALSMALAFLEGLLPTVAFLPPGVKLGLSNIITMYALFCVGEKRALLIALLISIFVLLTRCTVAGILSLSGGILSNSYSVSKGEKGVLFNQYKSGDLINTYWDSVLTNPVKIPGENLKSSKSMSEDEMKSIEFTNLLNKNRGEYGVKWGQSSTGYPYFGENKEYNPENPSLPENKYKVIFESYEGEEMELNNQLIHLSPDFVDSTFKIAGKFKLVDVAEGSTIEWSCSDIKPKNSISIGSENGSLRIDSEGSAIITATERKANGETEVVATIKVVANSKEIEQIKLTINGNDVTNGKYTVAGSEWKDIKVEARYEGSEEYTPVTYSRFTYTADDTDMVYNITSSPSFYFKKPGTASIKVVSNKNPNVAATVEVKSHIPGSATMSLSSCRT
mgnify:CR=1 FL=1